MFSIKIESMKRLDLANKKFGRLTVKNYSHSHRQPSGQMRAMWNVVCDCGKPVIISTANLTSGNTISCGCYVAELRKKGMIKTDPESMIKEHFSRYKSAARKRKKSFDLTYDQFKTICSKDCEYCGQSPKEKFTKVKNVVKIKLNGIDRVDNNLGYSIDNCVSSCGICNSMKMDRSQKEFLNKIMEIYQKCHS